VEHIRVERTGLDAEVGTLTIDRRERFNSLDVRTARDLRKAALQLARDPNVRAVVIRGAHGVFCSGADLKYVRVGGDPKDLAYLTPEKRGGTIGHGAVFRQILEYLHSTISEIRRAPKPFIAAVDGSAAAGGLGLALSCDLVLASERSTFEYAYFKTGLSGAESSTFFLPKLLGLQRASSFALLNPRLRAREAMAVGLVGAVFPNDAFDAETSAIAARLASGPTAAMAAAKRLMNEAAGVDRLDHHLDRELDELGRVADGPDFAEGLRAFFEKSTPLFRGK
jgi:2-(1,2-epoxy-1,2-dihydrophenyl)acetyl-CoA isomerase